MRQFFETYRDEPKLAPLVRELTWTTNLLIMAGAKSNEAREFYPLCIFFLTIMGADWPPYRSQYALPLACAFMPFYLIKTYRKKAAAVVIFRILA